MPCQGACRVLVPPRGAHGPKRAQAPPYAKQEPRTAPDAASGRLTGNVGIRKREPHSARVDALLKQLGAQLLQRALGPCLGREGNVRRGGCHARHRAACKRGPGPSNGWLRRRLCRGSEWAPYAGLPWPGPASSGNHAPRRTWVWSPRPWRRPAQMSSVWMPKRAGHLANGAMPGCSRPEIVGGARRRLTAPPLSVSARARRWLGACSRCCRPSSVGLDSRLFEGQRGCDGLRPGPAHPLTASRGPLVGSGSGWDRNGALRSLVAISPAELQLTAAAGQPRWALAQALREPARRHGSARASRPSAHYW